MKEVQDVKGYFNIFGEYEFDNESIFEGKILLDKNGWFEGIINHPNSKTNEKNIIFGIYHPNKVIELVKLSNRFNPFVYRAISDDKSYYGEYSSMTYLGEIPFGSFKIDIKNNDFYTKEAYEELEQSIKNLKENIKLDLFDHAYSKRERLSKSILDVYQNIISNETLPKQEKVSYKYAKKLQKLLNNPLTDDLK